MAQLRKGTTYATGDQATAANLNALVDNAIILNGAITEQTAGAAVSTDNILVAGAADLRKVTVGSLLTGLIKADGTVPMVADLPLVSSTPSVALSAASKGYVDSSITALNTSLVPRDGSRAMTADLPLVNSTPAATLSAASKGYVDTSISNINVSYLLPRDGTRAMTGELTLSNSSPVNDLSATSKLYVTTSISTAISGLNASTFVLRDGTRAMTGELALSSSTPINAISAASKGYVDAQVSSANSNANNRVARAGDTMTGALVLSADPVLSLEAATKQYTDKTARQTIIVKLNARQKSDNFLRQWAITSWGGLITWGRTNSGASGTWWNDDRTIQQTRPYFNVAIPSGVSIIDISSNNYFTVCLLSNGWVYSTGYNANGQLGHGDTVDKAIFYRIEYFVTNSIFVSKISIAGSKLAYGISSFISSTGDLYTCGYNGHGGLGIGSTTNASIPTKVIAISNVSQIIFGDAYVASVLALDTSGNLYGWGYNNVGQIGLGATTQFNSPQLVTTAVSKFDITTGGLTNLYNGHSIVLKTNGDVYTTGFNGYGQLGLGDTTNRNVLTKISTISSIVDIGCAGGYPGNSYAVSSTRRLYTWGHNGLGVVGDNTLTNATSPYNVNKWSGNLIQDPPFIGKQFLVFTTPCSYSYNGLCIIDSDGRIFVSGVNSGLANGNSTSLTVFTELIPSFGPSIAEKAVSASYYQNDSDVVLSILTNEGNIYSIGRNAYGVCNVGLDADSPTYRLTFNRQNLYA